MKTDSANGSSSQEEEEDGEDYQENEAEESESEDQEHNGNRGYADETIMLRFPYLIVYTNLSCIGIH